MGAEVKDRRSMGIRGFLVVLALVGSYLAFPAAALAQTDPYSEEEPRVLPTRLEKEDPSETPSRAVERPSGGALPVTGAELTLIAMTGLVAIKTGATLVRRTRPSP